MESLSDNKQFELIALPGETYLARVLVQVGSLLGWISINSSMRVVWSTLGHEWVKMGGVIVLDTFQYGILTGVSTSKKSRVRDWSQGRCLEAQRTGKG